MTLEQIERAKAGIANDITEIIAEAELLCEKLPKMLADLDEVVTPEDTVEFDSKWNGLVESLNCIRL